MIHVASLLHDDVIDNAETRRGLKSLNSFLGNKLAILAGDFLLARASVTLASLRNYQVIQLLSQVIEDLVSGEVLQVSFRSCCQWQVAMPLSPRSLASGLIPELDSLSQGWLACATGRSPSC